MIHKPKAGCLTLLVLFWLGALSVRAEYLYVATNGAGGDYRSWTTAATNIQDAVNTATNDDIVLVSNGVYTTTTPVVLEGAGNIVAMTNRITLKSVNGPTVTVIDGNYPARTARVVYISRQATLDGFTVRNGYVNFSNSRGGGINIWNEGDAHGGAVTNCIVFGNYASANGGGISIYNTTGVVANCTIYSNTCGAAGGGIYIGYTQTGSMINNCVVWGNKVVSAGGGGGLYSHGSRVTVKNCLIYGNDSFDTGGGVRITYTAYALSLENCTITANTATNTGGGLWITNTATQVRNSIIYNNSAGVNSADAFTTNLSVLMDSCIGDTNGVLNWNPSVNITNNPQFIDVANKNYRLLSSSPCINTGTNQSWMTDGVDLDGRPRIRYRWVDMGAYEHINRGTIYGFQ